MQEPGADDIRNKPNYYKIVLLTTGPCTAVMLYVYKWLYAWCSIPNYLADHLDKIPEYEKNRLEKGKERAKATYEQIINDLTKKNMKIEEFKKKKNEISHETAESLANLSIDETNTKESIQADIEKCKKREEKITRKFKDVFENNRKKFEENEKSHKYQLKELYDRAMLRRRFTDGEIVKIKSMKKDNDMLNSFDLTFLYKLILLGTNSCRLDIQNYDVWSHDCPENLKNNLEYLLFLVKEDRNQVYRKDQVHSDLTKRDIDEHCSNLHRRLISIIEITGRMANRDDNEVEELSHKISDDIKRIQNENNISALLEPNKDTVQKYFKENLLKSSPATSRSLQTELNMYCIPTFSRKLDGVDIEVDDILSHDAQVVVFIGEAGFGKTLLSKHLHQKLETENDFSYVIVKRITCSDVNSRNVQRFLEEQYLPIIKNLPDTDSWEKHIKDCELFYIMDGFDEATPEFKRFLESLLINISEKTKIIITTRPVCLDEINFIEGMEKMSMLQVSINCFTDDHINSVANSYLGAENDAKNFFSFYQSLTNCSKDLMRIPFNTICCIELWKTNHCQFREKLSMQILCERIFEKQIYQLIERHERNISLQKQFVMKNKVKSWYYETLCKIAAESLDVDIRHGINKKFECELYKSASDYNLIEIACLSTFLHSRMSSCGLVYFFRNRNEQLFLASLYLKKSNDVDLKEILREPLYLESADFNFILECCDRFQLSRILRILSKYNKQFEVAKSWLDMKI